MKERCTRALAFLLAMVLILGEMPVVSVHAEESVTEVSANENAEAERTVSEDEPLPPVKTESDDRPVLQAGHDYELPEGELEFVIHADDEDDLGLYELTWDNSYGHNISSEDSNEYLDIASCRSKTLILVKKQGDISIKTSVNCDTELHCSNVYKITDYEFSGLDFLYEIWSSTDFSGNIEVEFSSGERRTYSGNDYIYHCLLDLCNISFLTKDESVLSGEAFSGWKIEPLWCDTIKYVPVRYYATEDYIEGTLSEELSLPLEGKMINDDYSYDMYNYFHIDVENDGVYSIQALGVYLEDFELSDGETKIYYSISHKKGSSFIRNLQLKKGTYWARVLCEHEYELTMSSTCEPIRISIVTKPYEMNVIDLSDYSDCNTYYILDGLAVEIEYSNEEIKTYEYGSDEWLEADLEVDRSFSKEGSKIVISTYNDLSATIDDFTYIDGADIAQNITVGADPIEFSANYETIDGKEIRKLGHVLSLSIDKAGTYMITRKIKSYEAGCSFYYTDSLPEDCNNKTIETFSYSVELNEGTYYFMVSCSEDFYYSIKEQDKMKNVTYSGLKDVYVANVDNFNIDYLRIYGELNGNTIEIKPYSDLWNLHSFGYVVKNEAGRRVYDLDSVGNYKCIVYSNILSENIEIPFVVKSLKDFVQYTLTPDSSITLDANADWTQNYINRYDSDWIEIKAEENGVYKISFDCDNVDEDEDYCNLYSFYDEDGEAVEDAYCYDNVGSCLLELSGAKLYLRVNAEKEVTIKLEKANSVKSISVKSAPYRNLFYCGLDKTLYYMLKGLVLELTLEDGTVIEAPYDDHRDNAIWYQYNLKATKNFNVNTPGQKKVQITALGGTSLELELTYVDKEQITESIVLGESIAVEANAKSGGRWFKLVVPETRKYRFTVNSDDEADFTLLLFEEYDYDEVYGLCTLYANEEYYVWLEVSEDYEFSVTAESYFTEIIGVTYTDGDITFLIESLNFNPRKVKAIFKNEDGKEVSAGIYGLYEIRLFNSSNKEYEDFDWEDYSYPAGDYYWRISTSFTNGGVTIKKDIPFTIHSLNEAEGQKLGEMVEVKSGETFIIIEAEEDGLYLFDTTKQDKNYFNIWCFELYQLNNEGIDNDFSYSGQYKVFNLKAGKYKLCFDFSYSENIYIQTKLMPEIVEWDWNDDTKNNVIRDVVPTCLGMYSIYNNLAINVKFEDGTERTLSSTLTFVDGIPYTIDLFFGKRLLGGDGKEISNVLYNAFRSGNNSIEMYSFLNPDSKRIIDFSVIDDDLYFDNIISLDHPSKLVEKRAIIEIQEDGQYSIVCDDNTDHRSTGYIYAIVDGTICTYYEEENGSRWKANSFAKAYIYDTESANAFESFYMPKGKYLFEMYNDNGGEYKLIKQRSISSIDVISIPTIVYKEIGFNSIEENITIQINYSDGTYETKEVDLVSICDCNYGPNSGLGNLEIKIENNSIADRSWLSTDGRVKMQNRQVAFEKLDDNYYWVIEDKTSNTTKRINFKLDTIANYDKVISPGSSPVKAEYDERLGYGLIAIEIPETAAYTFKFHKDNITTVWLGYDLRNTEDESLLHDYGYNPYWENENVDLYSNYYNTDDNKLKSGLYYFFFSKTSTEHLIYFDEISIQKLNEIEEISNIQSRYELTSNTFLEGDSYYFVDPLIQADINLSDGSIKKNEGIYCYSGVMYTQYRSNQLEYKIKKKDGSDPDYVYDYPVNRWTREKEESKVNLLPAGEYVWIISNTSGKELATIPFTVIKADDALCHTFDDELDPTDKRTLSYSETILRKVVVPEGKQYKLVVPTLNYSVFAIEIISDAFNDDKTVEKKVFRRKGGDVVEDIILNPGTYVMRGYLGDCTLVETSVATPTTPTFSGINQQEKDVHLTWSESENATQYEIQISINGGEYTCLATIADGSCDYVDETEKTVGCKYKYRIKASNQFKESDYAESEEYTYLGNVISPVISSVTSVENGIKIEWNQVENAEGYYIFVSQDGTDFEQIDVINDASVTEYITENKVLGNTYIYAIKAFNKAYTSAYSNQGSVEIPDAPTRPMISEIKQINETIKVTWTESANATSYELQLSVNSAPYETLATISDGSLEYIDSSAKTAGAVYKYRIKGINSETESTFSEVVSLVYVGTVTTPKLSIDKSETTKVKLTWDKIENAIGYEIYASVDKGEYLLLTKIENATITEYAHADMEEGKKYSYKIKAYNSVFSGELSNAINACLADKTNVGSLTANSKGIEILWNKVSNATGYEIFRKSGNGSFEKIATITSGSKEKYEDTKVTSGKTYTYQIKTISGHLVSQAGTADSIKYITSTKVTSGGSKCMTASISWKKVSGASEYNIYRKTGKEEYKLIKTVKSSVLKYDDTDKNLKAGTKYSYKVAAKSGDSIGIMSAAVDIKIVDHEYTKKVIAATTAKDGKITVSCKNCKRKETEKIPAAKKIEISATEVTYTGKALKPAITIATSKGVAIDKKYYSISYSDNKAIGTATATIKFTGNYTGTIKKTFKILPAQTKLTKLTGASKAFTAGISAGKGADGYEIYYSTSDKFKSVYKKLNKSSVKSVTFKKLKAKTKYYVKVRSYKAVKENGKTVNYYSDWSPVLTVIIK